MEAHDVMGDYWAEAAWEGTPFGPRVYRVPEPKPKVMSAEEQRVWNAIMDAEYARRDREEGRDERD